MDDGAIGEKVNILSARQSMVVEFGVMENNYDEFEQK
jgi:hypothetical protein